MKNQSKSDHANLADLLMEMVGTLSLFSRITINQWLPALLADMNITQERYMALFELRLQPDCSLKQLAQNLMVSPSNLSVMIDAMVQQGLVSRVTDPQDRRRVLLRLNGPGEEICQTADRFIQNHFNEFTDNLDPDDQVELARASAQMIAIARKIIQENEK